MLAESLCGLCGAEGAPALMLLVCRWQPAEHNTLGLAGVRILCNHLDVHVRER